MDVKDDGTVVEHMLLCCGSDRGRSLLKGLKGNQ